ncbi:TIM-barrel domain-containing protein [Parabacteroides timonensis]|uniref:TIM-barrel domain-containing protein n=1 Tax=Parabacteroides timonensis TaxID=1871013 RepID=UPI00094E3CC1|nr:TIM-barrel domain-containing protein [Parabacteroides timonensis]
MRKLTLLLAAIGYVAVAFSQSNVTSKDWGTNECAGVWKLSVGKPEKINLLSELNNTPKREALQQMPEGVLPISPSDVKVELRDGKTYISFPLEKGEKIFGLGLHFKTVEQRGRIMRLHMDHYGDKDDGRTHAPVPFFVSSRGYGVLINSARYIDVWVGTAVRKDSPNVPEEKDRNMDADWPSQPYSDNIEILVPATGVEMLLFAGPTMLDVVRRYNLYNGGGTLPPRWGLGFWHRTPTLFSDKDVKNEVAEFEKRGFPLSVIGLEPGWHSKAYPCTYEWDKSRFPDASGFVKEMLDKGIELNLWMNPYVSKHSEVYDKIKPYTGSHTVWLGEVPDYSMPEVQRIMTGHFKKHQLDMGVSGYKMDENDGYDFWLWPDVATFPSGIPAEQLRNLYGSLMQYATTKMYREQNKRTYGQVRAANAGTNSYPYVLYNDYYDHKGFITALINSSFIGVLWTPEVRSSKTSEEWLRRMQTVCFSPIAQLNAWADGTKPWTFPDVEKEIKEISLLRIRLIPYLYSTFADYAFYGTPPVRAMNLEDGYAVETVTEQGKLDATENPYAMAIRREVKDQFMVGENILVAPLFTGQKERKVILPKGKWYDFYTGKLAGEGEVITVKPTDSNIPVYVKDGGIIPLWPAMAKFTDQKYPLEVRHYGTKPGTYFLYDDDGSSYDYEKGAFTRIDLNVTVDKKGRKKGKAIVPKGKQIWSFSEYNFRFMTE